MKNSDMRLERMQRQNQELRRIIKRLQRERNRFKVLAYNAIVKWREDAMEYYIEEDDEIGYILDELGATETEYKMIMED